MVIQSSLKLMKKILMMKIYMKKERASYMRNIQKLKHTFKKNQKKDIILFVRKEKNISLEKVHLKHIIIQ